MLRQYIVDRDNETFTEEELGLHLYNEEGHCIVCGDEISKGNRRKGRIFCSNECSNKYTHYKVMRFLKNILNISIEAIINQNGLKISL